MVINNIKIVTDKKVIENGYIQINNGKISKVCKGTYTGSDNVVDGHGKIAMPGFVDLHIHGSCGIDFMDATSDEIVTIANKLYSEGTTTFLATTLTSDHESLKKSL